MFGDAPLVQREVLASGPDHVWVDGRPVHAQQIAHVTPVVGERLLLQDVPHLDRNGATDSVN